jgi:hypothetical protein
MRVRLVTLPPVTISSGGTAVRLSSSKRLALGAVVQANYSNVGRGSIGSSTVTTSTGTEIPAGDAANITPPEGPAGAAAEFDLSEIWIVSGTSGDTYRISYWTKANS